MGERTHQWSRFFAVLLPPNDLVFVQWSPLISQLYSIALITKFVQWLLQYESGRFSPSQHFASQLTLQTSSKAQSLFSFINLCPNPACSDTSKRNYVIYILYFWPSTYLCPKLSSYSPLISISHFLHREQYPCKNVAQPSPGKMPPALHLPCLHSFSLEYSGGINFFLQCLLDFVHLGHNPS